MSEFITKYLRLLSVLKGRASEAAEGLTLIEEDTDGPPTRWLPFWSPPLDRHTAELLMSVEQTVSEAHRKWFENLQYKHEKRKAYKELEDKYRQHLGRSTPTPSPDYTVTVPIGDADCIAIEVRDNQNRAVRVGIDQSDPLRMLAFAEREAPHISGGGT